MYDFLTGVSRQATSGNSRNLLILARTKQTIPVMCTLLPYEGVVSVADVCEDSVKDQKISGDGRSSEHTVGCSYSRRKCHLSIH